MPETASSSTVAPSQKITHPYGQWSTKREYALIKAMHKYHPFSLRRLEIRKAWRNVQDAVNRTDSDLNKLGMTSIKCKVKKIIHYYTDKQTHDAYDGDTSTEESKHEGLVLDLIALKEKQEAIKNAKESESTTSVRLPSIESEQSEQPDQQSEEEREEREESIENNPDPADYSTTLSEESISSNRNNEKDPKRRSSKKRQRDSYARDMIDAVLKTTEEYRESQKSGLKSLENIIQRFDASSRVIMEETNSLATSIRDNTKVMDQLLQQQVHHQNLMNQQMMQVIQSVNFTLARFNNQVPIDPQHHFNPQQPPVVIGPPPQYNYSPSVGIPPPPPPPPQQQQQAYPMNQMPPQQQQQQQQQQYLPPQHQQQHLPPQHQAQPGPPPQQPTNQAPATDAVPPQPQQPNKPVSTVIPDTQSRTRSSSSLSSPPKQQSPEVYSKRLRSKRLKKY
ncbi:hypothetical protein BD770DRAFT_383670 [Pilaira anomala]|nr:hypothetical protein BD770DRAFT_383670 [Pilaira anomala]